MSTETKSEEPIEEKKLEPPPLPEKISSTRKLTFIVPHILKSSTIDEQGFTHRDVREGGPRQIDFETVIEYGDTPVEGEEVFAVKATNQLNFAGSIINVLSDSVSLPDFTLAPTSPTATEYLALVGTRQLVSSISRAHKELSKLHEKPIYQTARIYIVSLP